MKTVMSDMYQFPSLLLDCMKWVLPMWVFQEPWKIAEVWMIYTFFFPFIASNVWTESPIWICVLIKNSVSYLFVNNWAQGHAAAIRNIPWFHVQGFSYLLLTKIIFYSHSFSCLSSKLTLCSAGFLFGTECFLTNCNVSKQIIIFVPRVFLQHFSNHQLRSMDRLLGLLLPGVIFSFISRIKNFTEIQVYHVVRVPTIQ